MSATNTICAIIVTYHPDFPILDELLKKLSPQVAQIIIINNTATSELANQIQQKDIIIINPGKNIGLGAAYNQGIALAQKNNFEYVLLFDQDSCPAENMVEILYLAYQKLAQKNKIAVVGPNHVDSRTQKASYTVQLAGCQLKKTYCNLNNTMEYLPSLHIISSGSLLALKNIKEIGLFDETLFIDYVDIEWGLRAKSKGYKSYYICPAILRHRLGENLVNFLGRKIPFYNPLRCYYTFRNAVILCKRPYIPFGWKIHVLYKTLQRYIFYILYSSTKSQHIKMMSYGLWDGVVNTPQPHE
ncbi:MAG: glycosyltransferase family 2 protein [Gammaproteobacteria bacterium]